MKIVFASLILLLTSCSSKVKNDDNGKDSIIYNYDIIPTERSSINSNPVKIYDEATGNSTQDELKVSLFETTNTFYYLIKMQFTSTRYKKLEEIDTLKVPNFGIQPSVEIIKGDKRPSCIVGFLDAKKNFKESKLIYFEDGKLKVHVLKHYAVATYQDQAN